MNQIKSGFYWVKFISERDVSLPHIFVAECTGYDWYVPGIDDSYRTEDFIILSECLQPPTEETIMHTNEQMITKVNELRDMDMLLDCVSFPEELHSEYARILKEADTKAWAITEELFPEATIDEHESVVLTPDTHPHDRMGLLSTAWWMRIDAAIAKL